MFVAANTGYVKQIILRYFTPSATTAFSFDKSESTPSGKKKTGMKIISDKRSAVFIAIFATFFTVSISLLPHAREEKISVPAPTPITII